MNSISGFLSVLRVQASLKKFMDYIQTSAVDKMVKFLDKGLDPNYQDSDTGGKEHQAFSSSYFPYFIIFLSSVYNINRLHLYFSYLKHSLNVYVHWKSHHIR